ncbi:MAG TPA: ketopantoate reductase C-terminal domain-containing protein, partial [Magnetospirillaceae bacterium]|nr:ketopantoate reductase C-terminal domain-containing protein [Magnetospirillaceae bacterium]
MILAIDAVRERNATTFTVGGTVHFGEARNPLGAWSARVARVAAFFDRAGVRYTVPEDMVHALWFKLMVNVGVNPASAILGAPYSSFQRFPEARNVMRSAMSELIGISKVLGTGLTEADIAAWDRTLAGLSPAGKSSMLQDVEGRRKTEVELFAGTVVRLGRETGVPTPVNSLLFNMVRTIERGYGY